ncbi:glycosyltransferase [Sphingomonas arenae]|uniref:glycosyltransferase n=1 Tax=Sphingomonas arenae TaxID=2812555 RepID=UPI00234FC157|nr:glycosyltransferase [Sphingomonas arenae]
MRISAVVPTLNDAHRLEPCLSALSEADEIIVADGGSTDATVSLASAAGATMVRGSPGLAAQLARGAEASRYGGLLFVPPGTVLDSLAVWRARKHLNRSLRPGCFWLCIEDDARRARLVEKAVDLRTRLLQLPSLSQGLAVRKDRYMAAGGYRPLPVMSHEDLLHRLPAVVQLPDEAFVSGEGIRRDGWVRRSSRTLVRLGLWHAGVAPDRIAALTAGRQAQEMGQPSAVQAAE